VKAAALLCALAGTLPFLPALGAGFVADDFNFLWWLSPDLGIGARELVRFFTDPHLATGAIWRPLPLLTWSADYVVHGADPRAFHATALLLNALAIVALHALALRWLGPAAALAAALLFALHPAHAEAVVWTAARNELLVAVTGLVTLLCWERFLRRGSRGAAALACVAFALALASKETAVGLPVVLWARAPRRLRALAPFLALLAAYFAVRAALLGDRFVSYGGVGLAGGVRGLADLWRAVLHLAAGDPGGRPPWPWLVGAGIAAGVVAGRLRPGGPGPRGSALPALGLLLVLAPLAWTVHVLPPRHLYLPSAFFALALGALFPAGRAGVALAGAVALAGLPLLRDGVAGQVGAARATAALQQAALGARERHPDARHVVLVDVPRTEARVSLFHTGFPGVVRRPFLREDVPALPILEGADFDLDRLALALEPPIVLLHHGRDRVWREVAWLPAAPGREELPEEIELTTPADGATVDLGADPPFAFRPRRARRWYRVVFGAFGQLFPYTLDAARLRETAAGLEWRLSEASVFPGKPVPPGALADLRGRTVTWWVEGTDELRAWRATASRSRTARFEVAR
jgi:hypothetical protein